VVAGATKGDSQNWLKKEESSIYVTREDKYKKIFYYKLNCRDDYKSP